jgi:VRR-NUC domain
MNREHFQQVAIFQWLRWHEIMYPDLTMFFSVPNGGKRPPRTAIAMKQEGQKAGIPDIIGLVPMSGYHGLILELKSDINPARVTPEQKWWINKLNERGYLAKVVKGSDEAINAIIDYLHLPQHEKLGGVLNEFSKS